MTTLRRAILVVLDGVGAGANPDAQAYGDEGASSLEHCAQALGGLELPHLGASVWAILRLFWARLHARMLWERMDAWHRLPQEKTAPQAIGR